MCPSALDGIAVFYTETHTTIRVYFTSCIYNLPASAAQVQQMKQVPVTDMGIHKQATSQTTKVLNSMPPIALESAVIRSVGGGQYCHLTKRTVIAVSL